MQTIEPTILPYITFLIATHNRRDVLLETLTQLLEVEEKCALLTQTIVIDNASTDGTADAVAAQFPSVRLLRNEKNSGSCAKNLGIPHATGKIVMFLDDDSAPLAASLEPMIEYFAADEKLGTVVFDVVLPDGSHECSAYPKVFIGCGVAFRRAALEEVGGLPENFFMQAEEYDLSLRLLEAGWDIQRIDALKVMHRKTPVARRPLRTTRLDTRNNLMLVTRYFPRRWLWPFAVDWMRRYRWIALQNGWQHLPAFWIGLLQGVGQSLRPGHRRPLSLMTFEHFSMTREISQRMRQAVRDGGYRTILLVDVGKNILPFFLAAQSCGVKILAIADSRLSSPRRRYHGVPILHDDAAARLNFDAAFVANVSPVHAAQRATAWRQLSRQPVFDLFENSSAALAATPLARVA